MTTTSLKRSRPVRGQPWTGKLARVNLPGLLFICGLGVGAELLIRVGILNYEFLPAPSSVLRAGADLAWSGELSRDVAHTLRSALTGWLVASAAGLSVGVWLGLTVRPWRYSMASIDVLRSIPSISFVPVAILFFGFSVRMELAIVIFVSWWPVLIGTIGGVRRVSPTHRDVARMLHLSTPERVRKIVLPSAMPEIVVALRLALSLALMLAVVAEMVGNPAGMGYALIFQLQAVRPDAMFAYLLVLGLLGLVLNTIFVWLTRTAWPGASLIRTDNS